MGIFVVVDSDGYEHVFDEEWEAECFLNYELADGFDAYMYEDKE